MRSEAFKHEIKKKRVKIRCSSFYSNQYIQNLKQLSLIATENNYISSTDYQTQSIDDKRTY